MCGICGKINFRRERKVDPALIERMATAMAHRGPDGHGMHVQGPVGIGHRRLSIIDLSRGAQPLSNEDGSIWIVFNGEIYNYQALRAKLLARGHVFKTDSDTEVIVHAYEEYGEECVKHLRGMFAFAIANDRDGSVFLARDRVGIKPLYYHAGPNTFVFASEVKAMLKDPDVPRGVNLKAIGTFLTHYYTAGEDTPFEGVKKLPPGFTLTVRSGAVRTASYWDLRFPEVREQLSLEDAAEKVLARLKESVRLHMIADVPVGFLLSGGVDSTALLSLAVSETGKKISSFTIGFEGEDFADERPYARLAAETFGTSHYDMTMGSGDFADFLPGYIWHMEEPVCEPPAIALHYVSKLAREHVKVVISGEGGDEAFGGYPDYRNLLAFERGKGLLGPFRHPVGGAVRMSGVMGRSPRARRYGTLMGLKPSEYYLSRASSPDTYFNRFRTELVADEFREVLDGGRLTDAVKGLHESVADADLLSQLLYVDSKTWLPDDLLVKADKITMASSLELRVPLLDHEVLEFAASLPSDLKVQGAELKRVLKRAFQGLVPKEIVERKKTGFPVPYASWMKNELKPFVRDTLLDGRATGRGYFKQRGVEELLRRHDAGEDCSKDVFSLVVLELWHRAFVDGKEAAVPTP